MIFEERKGERSGYKSVVEQLMQRPWGRNKKDGVSGAEWKKETVVRHGHIEKPDLTGPYKLL